MQQSSTILGLGVYIPEHIRTNDYWGKELVNSWSKGKNKNKKAQEPKDSLHQIMQEEIAKLEGDPFSGMIERRVTPSDVLPIHMEIKAAAEAIKSAELRPEDIDLLMCFSLPPTRVFPPDVFRLHNELGLKNAFCFGVNAICHSFLTMMDMAHQYITNGVYKNVLIVVSTKYSSIMDYSSSLSVIAGDGAAAAVLGPCPAGKGLKLSRHWSETESHDSMIVIRRAPLRTKTEETAFGPTQSQERLFFTISDPKTAKMIISRLPHWAERIKDTLFSSADLSAKDISLLLTNAAFVWYTPVIARILGIDLEKTEDNILRFSNMGAVNLPMNLYTAWQKGKISSGENVLLVGHGGGANYGFALLEWV